MHMTKPPQLVEVLFSRMIIGVRDTSGETGRKFALWRKDKKHAPYRDYLILLPWMVGPFNKFAGIPLFHIVNVLSGY